MSKTIRKNDIIQLEISDLAFGGKGVAKLNGFVVLIAGGIPGDLVKAKIKGKKTSYAQGEVVKIIRRSPLRVDPRCSHFDECGGCTWQNLKYEAQLKYKANQVKNSLIHIGGFKDFPIKDALGSNEIFFYRNKMEFSFDKDSSKNVILGLHKRGRFDQIFDLNECFLESSESNQIVDFVRLFAQRKKLIPYDIKQHTGFLRFLTIREGKNTNEAMVNLVTNAGDFKEGEEFASLLIKNFPSVKSVVRTINSKLANIAIGEEEKLLAGKKTIIEKLKDFCFEISASSFFQTNTNQAQRLYDLIYELADLDGSEVVLDLYSGTGTISIWLARHVKKMIGIESLSESVADAQRNAFLNDISNCQFIQGEVKKVLSDFVTENKIPDVMILDPPRAGLHPQVVKSLIKMKVPKIVYVSCNPATQARDLKLLCEDIYNLDQVHPVDMFPHTYHIESVVKLSMKKWGRP